MAATTGPDVMNFQQRVEEGLAVVLGVMLPRESSLTFFQFQRRQGQTCARSG